MLEVYDDDSIVRYSLINAEEEVNDEWYPLGTARDEDHHSTVPMCLSR